MKLADVHVSIIGGCILRDIIGIGYDNGVIPENEGYIVDRYVQTVSPVSAVQNTKILDDSTVIEKMGLFDFEDFSGITIRNFNKRNFKLDIGKSVFDYMFEVDSEYLIIDMTEARFNLIKFFNENKETYLTDNNIWYDKAINRLDEHGYINMNYESVVSDDEIKSLIEKYVPVYLKKLLEHYPEERIVFLEVLPCNYYVDDKTAFVCNKDTVRRFRTRIGFAYSVARKVMKKAHFIEFPYNVQAAIKHKWGKNCMHYTEEYYNYALEAFNIIMHGNNKPSSENKKLKDLKEKYSRLYYDKYNDVIIDSLEKKSEDDKKSSYRFIKYSDYFKTLVLEPEKSGALVNYIFVSGRY